MAARMGFEQGSQDLAEVANIQLEGRQIQRLANEIAPQIAAVRPQLSGVDEKTQLIPVLYIALDGTGVPMMPPELAGRRGKQPDGTAKTREVKLAAVFTQTECDEKGNPVRDYQSTTYLASFQPAAELGAQSDDSLKKQIAFFENHRHQMLYLTYHNQGFFYGSGVLEAACKTVIGQRCKQSGMFWSEHGAQNILDLRCALMSRQWELCWDGIHQSDYLRLRTVA